MIGKISDNKCIEKIASENSKETLKAFNKKKKSAV